MKLTWIYTSIMYKHSNWRQTDRQTYRQTDRQTDVQTVRQADRQMNGQTESELDNLDEHTHNSQFML